VYDGVRNIRGRVRSRGEVQGRESETAREMMTAGPAGRAAPTLEERKRVARPRVQ